MLRCLHIPELSILNTIHEVNRGLGTKPLVLNKLLEDEEGESEWKRQGRKRDIRHKVQKIEDQKFQLAPSRMPRDLARTREGFTSWRLPCLNFRSSCHQGQHPCSSRSSPI